jgi:hypothetical protein
VGRGHAVRGKGLLEPCHCVSRAFCQPPQLKAALCDAGLHASVVLV